MEIDGYMFGSPTITVSTPTHNAHSGLPRAGMCLMQFDVSGPSDILLNISREELRLAAQEVFSRFMPKEPSND